MLADGERLRQRHAGRAVLDRAVPRTLLPSLNVTVPCWVPMPPAMVAVTVAGLAVR